MPLNSDSLNIIRTKDDKEDLISDLLLLENSLFESKSYEDFGMLLRDSVREKTARLINIFLKSLQNNDTASLKTLIETLKKEIMALKIVSFTLSFDPSEDTILRLSRWAREVLKDSVLIEIKVDKFLLGGVIVVYEGVYKDYSVRRILESKFSKDRGELLKLLQ